MPLRKTHPRPYMDQTVCVTLVYISPIYLMHNLPAQHLHLTGERVVSVRDKSEVDGDDAVGGAVHDVDQGEHCHPTTHDKCTGEIQLCGLNPP